MEKSFAKKFAVRRVNQRVGSKNLVQRGKRCAGSEQQSASREFQPLFLRSRFKLPDGAVSQPPRLGLHPRDEFAGLYAEHFFRRVIGLAEFIRESFDEVNAPPRDHNRRTFFE